MDIEKDVLEKHPVPGNLSETLKMDLTINTFLMGKGIPGKIAISKDKSLLRISDKIRDILGPLTTVWQQVERVRSKESDDNVIDIDELVLHFQHAIL